MRVHPALAERARDTARLMLTRLADPVAVADAVAASRQRATHPFGWGGPGLFTGPAGSAVAFQAAHRAFPAEAAHWRGLAHQHLVAAAQASFSAPLSHPGLSAGTAGLAFAFADSLREEPRYGGTLDKLDVQLAEQVVDSPSWRSDDGVRDSDYDAISGAAGTLGYLITVTDPQPLVRQAIDVLIDDLVWLCEPERWFIPPRLFPLESYSDRYPHGYVNTGLAHGIPGPLSALSLAHQAGYHRGGIVEAIRRTADYLVDLPCKWPAGVPLTESGTEDRDHLEPGRLAWCYGAPGVASALLNASVSLRDNTVRAVAVDGFESALRSFDGLPEVPLCHGAAGLIPICAVFSEHSAVARDSVGELAEHVLSHCDEDAPLIVRGDGMDDPSLLTGSAGVALALLTATGDIDKRWTRALLLA
ncbi:lanthionine synthetase C family protein [Allokutzneria sp. A3M-2-11 16]|uniref:lanthionine synthetase C family protein n=1 Tax=Allokutzneria sp. A3M-2-11 16 TaxID=2962043 RepID=UPI0020B6ABD9|nr:lanthionine synthetase C family protein [Allokutzneria sp. A3M-2-11 16]MCP3802261.1 lanthionine synthetase C family protein [Allokutzneria sp. A3M-2-11 16]